MSRLRRLFHLGLWGPRVEEGVDWEIEHHINERIDELIAAGASRAEAEAEARRAFGNVGRIRHEMETIDRDIERRVKFSQWLETVLQDVRYGFRGLVRNRGFAVAIVLTLGLGIGANASLFSVLDALVLRELPYPQPKELLVPWRINAQGERKQPYFSWRLTERLLGAQHGADELFAFSFTNLLYVGGADPVSLAARSVTDRFEETLGVQPLFGRGFTEEDTRPGTPPVVLLSYDFWRTAFAGDRSAVGKAIELDGKQFTVIGVMPKGFKFPIYSSSEVWLPIHGDGTAAGKRLNQIELVARVPVERKVAVQAQFSALTERIQAELSPENKFGARFEPLDLHRVQRDVKQALIVLAGAVLLILLIAGVNMINLLLTRGSARVRELAVRLAIGASRGRVVRQLATEALTMALLSGGVAVLIAFLVLRGVRGIMPSGITFFAPFAIAVEARTLAFTFGLTLVCGLGFGVLPAIVNTRRRSVANADLTRYAAHTVSRRRLRHSLVVVELALSVTLLVGAGLLMRSFVNLVSIDPGFEPRNLALMNLDVSATTYPNPVQRGEYLRRLEERLAAIPGVRAVTMSLGMPPGSNISFGSALQAEGSTPIPGFAVIPNANVRPNFLRVVGATLLLGRDFVETDDKNTVIVDEDLARALWPNSNPLGRRFRLGTDWDWLTVIGVMKDFKMMGPDTRSTDYAMLHSLGTYDGMGGQIAVAMRTTGDPKRLLPAIRGAVRAVDARQPLFDLQPATTAYAESIAMPRFLLVLISILAVVALALASIGVYGVLAYGVSQRTREIGVRIALGARASELQRMIVREGVMLAAVGVTLGLAGALALSRFIRSILFAVEPADPWTLIGVVVTLSAAALVASAIPARRATRVNPLNAIRAE